MKMNPIDKMLLYTCLTVLLLGIIIGFILDTADKAQAHMVCVDKGCFIMPAGVKGMPVPEHLKPVKGAFTCDDAIGTRWEC